MSSASGLVAASSVYRRDSISACQQCDQMATQFVKYLAIYNDKNLQNSKCFSQSWFKFLPNTKYAQKNCQILLNFICKLVKFRQIWPHCLSSAPSSICVGHFRLKRFHRDHGDHGAPRVICHPTLLLQQPLQPRPPQSIPGEKSIDNEEVTWNSRTINISHVLHTIHV